MYCRHKCFHTLFDLLKYGLMSKYNVMCSSLDPMEELTATSPYPSWSRTWAWVICPPPPNTHTHTHTQTGNPGSITEIECTLLSGSAEQDALTMKESPLNTGHTPDGGGCKMTNSFCCLYLLFSVSIPALSSFIKMLDPCTHNAHVCTYLLIVTYM